MMPWAHSTGGTPVNQVSVHFVELTVPVSAKPGFRA